MRKTIITSLMILCCANVVHAASAVLLENPSPLYFVNPGEQTIKTIESILVESIRRTTTQIEEWSIESTAPSKLVAKLVVRNKHTAFISLDYTPDKIIISYKDSYNLKFKKVQNRFDFIHPNYMKWVDKLVFNIKKEFQFRKIDLTETPIPVAAAANQQTILLAARAEPGRRDGLRADRTTEAFSKSYLRLINKQIFKTKPDHVFVKTLTDLDKTKQLIEDDRDNSVSEELCKTQNVDKIFVASSPANPGGAGTRCVYYSLYICANGRKFKEKYTIKRSNYDAFGYQTGKLRATEDFINYSRAYN